MPFDCKVIFGCFVSITYSNCFLSCIGIKAPIFQLKSHNSLPSSSSNSSTFLLNKFNIDPFIRQLSLNYISNLFQQKIQQLFICLVKDMIIERIIHLLNLCIFIFYLLCFNSNWSTVYHCIY